MEPKQQEGHKRIVQSSPLSSWHQCPSLQVHKEGPSPDPTKFSCVCGEVRGTVSPPSPFRLVCYCTDCQQWGHWVARQTPAKGGAPPCPCLLDAHGGWEVVMIFQCDVTLEAGAAHLQSTTLPPDKATGLLRYWATCCGTPVFATWEAGVAAPTVCMPSHVFRQGDGAVDVDLDAAFGPVAARVMAGKAVGGPLPADLRPSPSPGFGVGFVARLVARNLWARGRGLNHPRALDGVGPPVVREV
jgi:hypothetical protein